MPKIPEGKKGLFVCIDERVLDELQEYIKRTYEGSTYGALSIEVQNAIAEYLRVKHAQIRTKFLNPKTPMIHLICRDIIHKLKVLGMVNQVSSRLLAQVIGETRGADERTIRKWMSLLEKNGYIKNIGTYTWEIL